MKNILGTTHKSLVCGAGCLLLMVCLVMVPQKADAQYDPVFAHYYDMEVAFNPAASGKVSKLNITAAYALGLAGFENNPNTLYASADMPVRFLNSIHGVGVQFVNDRLGLFNHMRFSVMYSFKKKLFGGTLSAGVQAGLMSEKFEGSKVDTDEEGGNDPIFTKADVNGNSFDLNAGLYYTKKNWYVGFSGTHITSPRVNLSDVAYLDVKPTLWLTGGYAFKLRNPTLKIKTSVLGMTDFVSYRAIATGRLVYEYEKKMFYGGASYSLNHSVAALVGMNIRGINVSYSYEFMTSGMSMTTGSHELCIGYQMDVNLEKKGRNLHKAVRLL